MRSAEQAGEGLVRSPGNTNPTSGFCGRYTPRAASERIGDTAEQERRAQFLRDSSETAHTALTGQSAGTASGGRDTP